MKLLTKLPIKGLKRLLKTDDRPLFAMLNSNNNGNNNTDSNKLIYDNKR